MFVPSRQLLAKLDDYKGTIAASAEPPFYLPLNAQSSWAAI